MRPKVGAGELRIGHKNMGKHLLFNTLATTTQDSLPASWLIFAGKKAGKDAYATVDGCTGLYIQVRDDEIG